jgi:hypothetical protein
MHRREFIVGLSATYLQSVIKCKSTPDLAIDQRGLIVQTDGDGGDTAQREGWTWFGSWIRERELHNPWSVERCITFEQAMSMLEINRSGIFRRNPDKYDEPKDFSRDQSIPIIAAMGLWGDSSTFPRSTVNRVTGFLVALGVFFLAIGHPFIWRRACRANSSGTAAYSAVSYTNSPQACLIITKHRLSEGHKKNRKTKPWTIVGIREGKIAAISAQMLTGKRTSVGGCSWLHRLTRTWPRADKLSISGRRRRNDLSCALGKASLTRAIRRRRIPSAPTEPVKQTHC